MHPTAYQVGHFTRFRRRCWIWTPSELKCSPKWKRWRYAGEGLYRGDAYHTLPHPSSSAVQNGRDGGLRPIGHACITGMAPSHELKCSPKWKRWRHPPVFDPKQSSWPWIALPVALHAGGKPVCWIRTHQRGHETIIGGIGIRVASPSAH